MSIELGYFRIGILTVFLLGACGQGEKDGVAATPDTRIEVETATPAPTEQPTSQPPSPTPEPPTPLPEARLQKERIVTLPDGETTVLMVLVPGGKFTMGASPEERQAVMDFQWSGVPEWGPRVRKLVASAGPAHVVNLDTFYIDKYEVTNQQYNSFVQATGRRRAGFWDQPRFNPLRQPAVGVSWFDASDFCQWAGKRLPTEAEWEKAARGTQGLAYPWGNSWGLDRLHSAEGIAKRPLPSFNDWMLWRQTLTDASVFRPAIVGSFPSGASPYGAMDMAGNAWEWVADWYGPDYYAGSPENNPQGPLEGKDRVLRGGAFDVPRVIPYTWFRENFIPPQYGASMVVGFRCALSPD